MRALATFLAAAALLPAGALATSQTGTLVDRVVAVVDDDPILASDIDRVIGLGLVERREGESERGLRRRILDRLIDERLRFHEVARYSFQRVSVDLVEEQVEAIAENFPDRQAFEAELARLGLDMPGLRQVIANQLQVLIYVDELLGARVFVGLEEIRAYYDAELVPRLEAAGEPVPELDEVRESIRAVLREEQLNEELERWTEELRAAADVIDHFDREERELPPVIETIDSPADDAGGRRQ